MRLVQHDHVIQAFEQKWSTRTSLVPAPEWKPADVRIVGLPQERGSRRIIEAGSAKLGPDSANPHID